MTDMKTLSMDARLSHLCAVISHERFLKKEGLGNEVPFFICPYSPTEAVEMETLQKRLVKRLDKANVKILAVNLYDVSIEILKEQDIWQSVLEQEAQISKDELKELLQNVLDSREHLIPTIAQKMREEPFDVLFISGVGEVFPYIRSHNVLNNLQSVAKEKPTVLFFPGEYTYSLETGSSLDLFGKLHDDKYYRAFNIFHCEV